MERSNRSALLLIDLQVAFCDEEGSMARQGRDINAMKNAAIACDDLAVAARKYSVPVIWTRLEFAPDYSDGGLLTQKLRPNLARIGALQRGSEDAGLSGHVHAGPQDIIVTKARYSAMYGTSLEVELRARGIARLFVCGVTTSMCVESTVRDLGQRDYEVMVVEDACGDFDQSRHASSLEAMRFGFAETINSGRVREFFAGL